MRNKPKSLFLPDTSGPGLRAVRPEKRERTRKDTKLPLVTLDILFYTYNPEEKRVTRFRYVKCFSLKQPYIKNNSSKK